MVERKRVFLHIGAPKTGTTFLQQVLDNNREAMADAGILYPKAVGDANHTAVWSLRNTYGDSPAGRRMAGDWDLLVEKTREWQGHTVVISSELFVYSEAPEAAKILTSFGDAEVHVIYTARDLVRQIPAVWQEQIKNRRVMPYRRFLADVLGARKSSFARHFWSAQEADQALKRWSQGLDPRHVHIVTAPAPGAPAGELWRRFAGTLGLDDQLYPSDIPAVNPSLSVTAAEILRRYNARHGKDIHIIKYRRDVFRPLEQPLVTAVKDTSKLPLTTAQRATIIEMSTTIVDKLRAAGYDVVGSLDDLVPDKPGLLDKRRSAGRGPDDLTDAEIIDGLLDVLDDLLRRGSDRSE